MTERFESLGDFDPKAVYDAGSLDYEDAAADFWAYLSTRTVDRLGLCAGESVLDVPCGTAPSVIAAANAVGHTGRVTGIDYAENMLAIGRRKVLDLALQNVELRTGDMTALDRPEQPYDAIICVLGIFFVDDMPSVVRSFVDLVRPEGGRVAVAVFGERLWDPMRDVFVEAVEATSPGFTVIQPWSRVDELATFRRVFEDAGVGDVVIETDEDACPLPSPDDWWRIVMGSGLRRTVVALGDEAAAEVRARCTDYIRARGVTEVVSRSRYAIVTRRVE